MNDENCEEEPVNPLVTLAQAAEAVSRNGDLASTSQQEAKENKEKGQKKTTSHWTFDEALAFYECLKIHGRDWESISKSLMKKKVHKSVNQIKNFSFNVARAVRQYTAFDNEDLYKKIPADARELMMVMASMEWRKRTTNKKFHNDSLRELLFEGSTSCRFQKNKPPIVIEIPNCPSLTALFATEKRVEKFPSDVTIQMEPFTNGDQSAIASAMMNPFLKVKMGINDRLSRLFELLQVKWGTPLKHLSIDDSLNFRLFVHRDVDVGNVFFTETNSTPSLKRLLGEQERLENAKTLQPMQRGNFSCNPTFTVSTRIIDCPLFLKSEVLKEGLEVKNCGDASIAELFCVCGLQPVIRLMYNITNTRDFLSTWEVFADLIKREYPEALSNGKENRFGGKIAAKEMGNKTSQQTQTETCFLTNGVLLRDVEVNGENRENRENPINPSINGRKNTPKANQNSGPSGPSSGPSSEHSLQGTSSKIVDIENEEFLAQLRALDETSRKPLQRGIKRLASTALLPPPPPLPLPDIQQKNSPHTDFSSMKAPTERTTFGKNMRKMRSPRKKIEAQQISHQPVINHDETARHALNESDEVDASTLEIQCFGGPLELSQSPIKSISSFPMDLQSFSDGERMCAQVLNQNSVDFYSHFQQFVESFDQSPQKTLQTLH